jgi:hypothetical protein
MRRGSQSTYAGFVTHEGWRSRADHHRPAGSWVLRSRAANLGGNCGRSDLVVGSVIATNVAGFRTSFQRPDTGALVGGSQGQLQSIRRFGSTVAAQVLPRSRWIWPIIRYGDCVSWYPFTQTNTSCNGINTCRDNDDIRC